VSRSRQLILPTVTLDRRSSSPLHCQIRRQIEAGIRRGSVSGARLPSSRVLARLLGVSRNTVLVAYDELAAGGLIEGRRGAAMLVGASPASGIPDVHRLLRDAQYPARSVRISDPDENDLQLNYSR
jgi:DNA-binding transcriptional regulator YhcF (GntR family)